jgi:16S rRNA processing protein RimM
VKRVLIGRILRPRGLKGELKVEILTNILFVFSSVQKIFIDGREYEVAKGSVQNGCAYINLSGIDSIEKAEKFRNKEIYINADEIKLNDGEVLSDDLIGFAVFGADGKKIGVVKNIENYGGGDFFEIAATGLGYIQIPNESEFISETNMREQKIILTDAALNSETVL